MDERISPFQRWAGGKRWLALHLGSVFPTKYKRYIEPFLGSGAVFFHLKPKLSILSDINKDLITTYRAIKKDWLRVFIELASHHDNHNTKYYYIIRNARPTSSISLAARFIYLNRTCWNGLYRVNKDGLFNVPIGTKNNVLLPTDNFKKISSLLKGARMLNLDFEKVINMATDGDLVYADPPYTVKHDNNGFIKYNEKLFSWDDQVRLMKCLLRAKKRGAFIVLSNASHEPIKDLYIKHFPVDTVERTSIIAGLSSGRKKCTEYIIRNSTQ